jgi:hypothetical protein
MFQNGTKKLLHIEAGVCITIFCLFKGDCKGLLHVTTQGPSFLGAFPTENCTCVFSFSNSIRQRVTIQPLNGLSLNLILESFTKIGRHFYTFG